MEFGWNSSGGGTGGRGPFVVMATAGFHRLIDPPRSRSSTKPQSSPRSRHCLSHHLRNDGAVTTDTPLRTFSTGFVSIASNCVNDRPFSFLARLVRERSRVTKFRRRSRVNPSVGRRERRANAGKQLANNSVRGRDKIFKHFLSDVCSYARVFSYEQFPLRRINRVTRAVPRCSLVERTKSSTSDLRKNRWNASCCRIYVRCANTLCCSRCRFEPVPRVPPTYESGPLICIVPGAEVDRETAEVSGGSRRTRSYAKRELRGDTDYIQKFLLAVHVNSA